ncbi:GCN5-related N-acetyltransferase [Halorubrum aidingense JCM 13560]|uniref:GCN5-related N-acetyltransferase n=1 Tax=Halorubrum aidingense JCM 13560 TaxID=1230454 RepID=M0PHH5_9EURY|nr:GNAT family N-acetyltransferase [Halorubrum aidingense]EMA69511.1 GCN5-related N-acetyltransferase [Halorubrum aidingense JCM 13560]
MYVRDAKNRDEAWLLDAIEQLGLDDVAFRSRDYVIAVDQESGDRAGFGRLRLHRDDDTERIELTGIGVLPEWRGRGVGAHVVERLVDTAAADGFETVYVLTDQPEYLRQFGFAEVDTDELPGALSDRLAEKREFLGGGVVGLELAVDDFEMPERFREAFKNAEPADAGEPDATESPEDFGIDPESATYKYDTGR